MAYWGVYPGGMGAYKWAVCLPLYRHTLGQYRNEVWKLSKHMGTIGIYIILGKSGKIIFGQVPLGVLLVWGSLKLSRIFI